MVIKDMIALPQELKNIIGKEWEYAHYILAMDDSIIYVKAEDESYLTRVRNILNNQYKLSKKFDDADVLKKCPNAMKYIADIVVEDGEITKNMYK